MKRKLLGATLALAFAMTMPGIAYHIDGSNSTATPTTGLTSSDWDTPVGNLIVCESEGGAGVDDRNPGPGAGYAGSRHGSGGLCTTGENDATGLRPPGATDCAPAHIKFSFDANTTVADGDKDCRFEPVTVNGTTITTNDGGTACTWTDNDGDGTVSDGDTRTTSCMRMIDEEEYVALDVCDKTINARNGGNGPFAAAADCDAGIGGLTDGHSYIAEVGAFSCLVAKSGSSQSLNPTLGNDDFAFFYNRLYAWWSWDGDGWYTAGDFANAAHSGDGTPDNPAGSDNKDAWHGHAAVFIDFVNDAPTTSTGSVVTALTSEADISANAPTPLTDNALTALGSQNFTNNCGGSPSDPPSGNMGPAVRSTYTVSPF